MNIRVHKIRQEMDTLLSMFLLFPNKDYSPTEKVSVNFWNWK